MMRFKRSHRGSGSLARPARHVAAVLIAALVGGCSAEISRFDFPGFSLTDSKKETTTSSLQQPSGSDRGPSYLGNEGRSASAGSYDRGGYTAPRSNRENRVAMANLQEPAPSSPPPAGGRRYDGQPSYRQPTLRPGESVAVRPGDTLYGLSRRHHVSVAELMEVNGLSNPNLHPGQTLYLPEGYSVQRPSAQRPRATARAVVPPAAVKAKYSGSYTMRSGDSIYGISRSYGVPVAELQKVNGISNPREVRVGTVLMVPGSAGAEPAAQGTSRVAVAPPVVQSTRKPTVINRRKTQMASRDRDLSTGTITPPAHHASDKLRWPVHGKILTGFGQRNDGTHNDGINLSVPQGTAVHAAENGVVAYAGSELKGYGNLILVRHDNGWVTAYAHNEQLTVKRGDKVQRGQVIARAGRTGSVDQPQLHFELRQGSKPVDPVPFLERL